MVTRILCLVAAVVLLCWLMSHAGGFHPDGSPVDPDPPPAYLMFGGMIAYAVLIVYATGGRRPRGADPGTTDAADTSQATGGGAE
jgi:hypothetical protein